MVQATSNQQFTGGFDDGRPTVLDLRGADPLAQAARKHWASDKHSKFKPNAVKTDFYDVLEKEEFRYRSLLILEQLQFLEKSVPGVTVLEDLASNRIGLNRYLWPNFSDEATNFHVICIALMVNVKRRENVLNWGMVFGVFHYGLDSDADAA